MLSLRLTGIADLEPLGDALDRLLPLQVALAVHEATVNAVVLGAAPVEVTLSEVDGWVDVRVQDKGAPPAPSSPPKPSGRGLLLIRQVPDPTPHATPTKTVVSFRIPVDHKTAELL
ncbi:ATP-binding protein [Actinokineospora sp. G85]|uniref:ATP-binding protein n=1 Tax=Actinokineospora sp. G85 TaxID=3406626 RepID=UPI003C759258